MSGRLQKILLGMGDAWLVFSNGTPFTVDGKVLGKLHRYRMATFLPRQKLYHQLTVNGEVLAYR